MTQLITPEELKALLKVMKQSGMESISLVSSDLSLQVVMRDLPEVKVPTPLETLDAEVEDFFND